MSDQLYIKAINSRISECLNESLELFKRVLIFRCDFSYPSSMNAISPSSDNLSKFRDLLVQRLSVDAHDRMKRWGKKIPHKLIYVWVREFGIKNGRKHYHTLFFLNKDLYYSLGNLHLEDQSLANMVRDSWNTAIKNNKSDSPQVFFGRVFHLCRKDEDFDENLKSFIQYSYYLAKVHSKVSGDGYRSYGSSR